LREITGNTQTGTRISSVGDTHFPSGLAAEKNRPPKIPPAAVGDKKSKFISPEHEAEYRAFVEKHPDLEAVEFLLVDPNGVMRGKWAPADALKKAFQEGVNFPMSLHGLDVWGREVSETGLHIETGD